MMPDVLSKSSSPHEILDMDKIVQDYKLYTAFQVSVFLKYLNTSQFRARYASFNEKELDLYVFTPSLVSKRLMFECFAKIDIEQSQKVRSDEFVSNPYFEKVLTDLTNCKDRPNPYITSSRPWDVCFNMTIKVECIKVEDQEDEKNITLQREYEVMNFIWSQFHKNNCDFDEMVGIPMLFDFEIVSNDEFIFANPDSKRIDHFGQVKKISQNVSSNQKSHVCSSLCYMTLEKLGPNVKYLLQLQQPSGICQYPVFSFGTAFKIFDQLVCRLITLHRLGVIHGDVAPANLYFGRDKCINVVYLSHYKAAVCVTSKHDVPHSVLSGIGDVRFAPVFATNRGTYHPVDDLESAFYLLLSMITVTLPWDSSVVTNPDNRFFKTEIQKGNHSVKEISVALKIKEDFQNVQSRITEYNKKFKLHYNEVVFNKIKNTKLAFWKSPSMIRKLLANAEFEHSSIAMKNADHIQLASEFIMDLYLKIKDVISIFGNKQNTAHNFCRHLKFASSTEMILYNDIRTSLLLYFRFQKQGDMLNGMALQNKDQTLHEMKLPRVAWDLSVWCFSNIDMSNDGLKKGSVSLKRSKVV